MGLIMRKIDDATFYMIFCLAEALFIAWLCINFNMLVNGATESVTIDKCTGLLYQQYNFMGGFNATSNNLTEEFNLSVFKK